MATFTGLRVHSIPELLIMSTETIDVYNSQFWHYSFSHQYKSQGPGQYMKHLTIKKARSFSHLLQSFTTVLLFRRILNVCGIWISPLANLALAVKQIMSATNLHWLARHFLTIDLNLSMSTPCVNWEYPVMGVLAVFKSWSSNMSLVAKQSVTRASYT